MLGGSRGPLHNKKVFAGSDYLTASASRRYFNLGAILVQENGLSYLSHEEPITVTVLVDLCIVYRLTNTYMLGEA